MLLEPVSYEKLLAFFTDSFFKTSYRSLSIAVCMRAASNELRIATEHNELTRKGPRKQSKIFGIPVSLIYKLIHVAACVCFKHRYTNSLPRLKT